MPAIRFFEEDIPYKLKNKAAVRLWITETIKTEGFKGDACRLASAPYENILGGTVVSDVRTAEADEQETAPITEKIRT